MKAFLFGGDSNGATLVVENHLQFINMPKESKHVSFVGGEKPFNMACEFDRYIKYNERFKKVLNSGASVQMEDLGIFIHESFTNDEIESLSKIILMVIRADWRPLPNRY